MGVKGRELTAKGHENTFWSDEIVYIMTGVLVIQLYTLVQTRIAYLKLMNFSVCQLYFIRAYLRKDSSKRVRYEENYEETILISIITILLLSIYHVPGA